MLGLSAENKFAHEQVWVSETIAALLLSGCFYADVPGVSIVHVDLHLWGLSGRTHSKSPQADFVSGRREISDGNFKESGTFSVRELAAEPQTVAVALLERLLTSFDADDTIDSIVQV